MISVGDRDGDGRRRRKTVMELGFRSGEEDMMRGSELEEGEAGFIDLNNDDDDNNSSTIDPDVALSYIDEKLQDVLGHFQKDFEGGVSAENLGAKFGGYGSFLPSYQRSPSWCHPRTPTEYNQYGSRSIDNGQLQNYQTNSLYSSPDIISSNSVTRLRPASRIHQKNPLPYHGKQLTSKSELPNSTNSSDQKSWKVRIKVGKDELTSQKYADIYSGLGLDVSPSSSLNESPVESEGLHHDLPDISDESLSRILQIMTSTTLSGRLLLSPLSEQLICLTKKEWITGERDPKTLATANQGRSRTVADGSDLKMTDRDIGNKPKSIKQSSVSVSPTYNNKHISRAKSVVPKKETGLDCQSYDNLISSTMKLPLLSDADGTDFKRNSLKTKLESKISANGQVKSDAFSDVVERMVPEPVASFENGQANKNTKKSSVSGKAVVSRKAKGSNEKIIPRKREVDCTDKEDELAMKNGKHVGHEVPVRADTIRTPLQTVVEKKLDYGDDSLELDPGEAPSSSAQENRANGDHNIVAQDVMYPEDKILNNSPKSHQSKTSLSNSEDMMTRLGKTSLSNSEDMMTRLGKTVDVYKECIGDVELEKGRNNIETGEMASIQAGKGSGVQETRNLDKSINISKEKSMGKNSVDLTPLDRQGLASNVSHYAGKGLNPNPSTTAEAPLLNEDWVGCDKCHKWRILPLGTNPKSLPEKWVCSMLDWLPGMNHCDISQEDTTLASRAAQASISGSKPSLQPLSSKNISVVPTGDARRSIDDFQRSGIETHEVKMIHTVKDAAKGTNQENSPSVGNSKKRLHESTKTRSLNDIDNSPSINDFGYHHAGQTSSLLEGSYSEENQSIPPQNHSDKDDILKSRIKNKKDNEIDDKRASKRIKTGDIHLKDEKYPSDGRLPNIPLVKGHHDNNRFRISKGGIKNVSGSSERPEVLNSVCSDDGSQHLAVHRLDDNMKERKANDAFKSDGNDMRLPGSKNRSSRSKDMLTEHHETDERIPKKARVSKSEGKDRKRQSDYSGSPKKISRGTKDILGHDLVSTAFQRGTDAVEPLRKDLGLMQPSVAATSSSSKVSSSLRSKAGLNEMKDSPIESVSSSPLKAPGVGHFNHTKRDVTPHHDGVGFFQQASRPSPKISSHDEPIFDTDRTGKIKVDENMHHLEGVKNKIETSPHFTAQVNDCNVRSSDQGIQNARQMETLSQNHNEKRERERNVSRHSGHSKKAGKGSSSRSKDKKQVSRSVCDNGKVSHFDPIDVPLYEEKTMAGSNKSQGLSSVSCDRTDKSHISKKDSSVDCKDTKEEISTKVGVHDGTGARGDAITCPDVNQKVLQNSETGKSSKSLNSDKTMTGVSERGKSSTKQPSLRGQSESITNVQTIVELKKENGSANDNDEQSNALQQPKRPEKPIVNQQTSTRNSNSSIHKGRAVGESRDSSSQAVTNAVREAKDLKHMADRLKNSGSTESTGLYFQAALKFLHGACLLESCSNENGKQTKIQSMEMYSSTAKLCEFCAHEYEKSKDMAAAALAYKCVEVAYMRVIYTSHAGVNKVRNEVQTALQLVPTGDSPSSSASDIDNLNNAAIVDKAIASKGVDSPQVAGTQVITARNRSSCLHLIRFAQEVTFAMEASRKSRSRLGEVQQNKEGISSVKRALDFNFQDVDGLLHLVRVAMEAINR